MGSKTYFPDLNGLRFFAFFGIFFYHHQIVSDFLFIEKIHKVAYLGIDFFFVLSSFLLTTLALDESKFQQFSLKNFLIRRSLRIWPLYFLIVFGAFLVLPILSNAMGTNITLPPFFYYLFFISNYCHIDHVFFLVFLWSIAVEEQFYLFWGLMLRFFLHKINLVIIGVLLTYFGFRLFSLYYPVSIYTHTLNYFANFGIGAALAVFCHNSSQSSQLSQIQSNIFNSLVNVNRWVIVFLYIVFGIYFWNHQAIFANENIAIFDNLINSLFFAFVIFEQSFCKNSILKIRTLKPLNYLGKISYGLYCYHGIVITVLTFAGWQTKYWWIVLLNLVLTILLASISYELYEKRFLKLKEKFRFQNNI